MNLPKEMVQLSYDECRRIARQSRSNFTPCFYLLSGKRRRAMVALYAFMRHTDDLVDGEMALADAARALTEWRAEAAAALTETVFPCEPRPGILPALAETAERFEIPHEYLFAAIDGSAMDLSKHRYATFAELSDYCYRVASAVGLACLRIWGYRGNDPAEAAHACGVALQLTNILRDLQEDYRRGRVYLPQEDLERFGYSEVDLGQAVANDKFCKLMEFQVQRAERHYYEATKLAEGLDLEGRRIFIMIIRVYYRLLKTIQAEPARVFSEHVHVGRRHRLAIMARTLLHPSAKAVLP